MSNPQENTKIEQLTDAIESFAISVARSVIASGNSAASHPTPTQLARAREDARAEMATALRDFLKPSLRVINETARVEGNRASLADAIASREMPKYPGGIDDMKLA
jgi:hypothetical protein